jgi:glycerol-3-phosphate acyltransferase PlsX
MIIGLDIMGGDFAPEAALKGVLLSLEQKGNIVFNLIGNIEYIQEKFPEYYHKLKDHQNIIFTHAESVIEMGESPTKAYMHKPDSSIAIGYALLKTSEIDVFISAGNTGAMMVGAYYTIKAIEGIIRPTITSVVPKEDNTFGILLDVGINPDCRQDVLMQFGWLGSLFMDVVHQVKNPKVGLLNIGSEKEKGNLITQAAYSLMESSKRINFIGNVEGYDLLTDKADVVVCDGFTGNVVLKALEGVYLKMKERNISDEYFDTFNYENYGGTPILGINKPAIIGHGVSSPKAFSNMFNMAESVVENNLIGEIKKLLVE